MLFDSPRISIGNSETPQWFALLGGVGAGCAYLLAGLGVWLLVRERGSRLAALGAVATGLGGILFAAGLFAFDRPIAVTGIGTRSVPVADGLAERPGTRWARGATRYAMGSRSDPVRDGLAERPGMGWARGATRLPIA